ncbi:MAG: hypothetical protein IKI37_05925 [Oscillospiraceae bacterium]|nr:hypothetical protein [Oscillospiraceae bacterium]MBR7084694.1 hypothetical protein [Oscillospiraceae bacterium]
MKRKIFFITAVLMAGLFCTACGEKQAVSDEMADAPMTAPADIAPDVPELETAVTPETAPPVN